MYFQRHMILASKIKEAGYHSGTAVMGGPRPAVISNYTLWVEGVRTVMRIVVEALSTTRRDSFKVDVQIVYHQMKIARHRNCT
jgi:hypothetical protein